MLVRYQPELLEEIIGKSFRHKLELLEEIKTVSVVEEPHVDRTITRQGNIPLINLAKAMSQTYIRFTTVTTCREDTLQSGLYG